MKSESSYKDTILLPKTDFPMRGNLVEKEPQRLKKWEESNLYKRIIEKHENKGSEKFILHDGPPFANGDVHMGTALNKILKDFVLKSKSMSGYNCPYIPGWDCHGLPIEFKVVKKSKNLSPVEIRKRSKKFAKKFIDIQKESFKRLGVLADWKNPYLTLSSKYESNVIRLFSKLIDNDLIYQSKRPVQWSFGAQTALAEAEVEYKDIKSIAIFVKFNLLSNKYENLASNLSIVIWTTTPWTLPSNLAVAINPNFTYIIGKFFHEDKNIYENFIISKELINSFKEKSGFSLIETFKELNGKDLENIETSHPFIERTSKIITADFVTSESGTGAVHIAPGHGIDDYFVGKQNSLDLLSPVDDLGKFTSEVGIDFLIGEHVFDSNIPIIKLLAKEGKLVAKETYRHSYPHCWRSKTPIIFRSVPQFFIKVSKIKEQSLKEISTVKWYPKWGENRISSTVESRPDWCISRQRSWGIPIPGFYVNGKNEPFITSDIANKIADIIDNKGSNIWFEKDDAWWSNELNLPQGSKKITDTIDVWIDSGSSHFCVLDNNKDLHSPADLYLEATDQHRGWFQSSLMLSVSTKGIAPYKSVLTHGFVVDQDKKKLSKSEAEKSNKPIDAAYFYNKYGADILRLWVSSVDWQHEVPFGENLFKQTAEPYRRFRNILRIILANLNDFDVSKDSVKDDELTLLDRWILERLNQVIESCKDHYSNYNFHKVFHVLNQFCANDLSSFYIDITKDRVYCDDINSTRRRSTQTAMYKVFDAFVKLIAPILAYTADEAWEYFGKSNSIHLEDFPNEEDNFKEKKATQIIETLSKLRNLSQVAIDAAIKSKLFNKREQASVDFYLNKDNKSHSILTSYLYDSLEFLMVSKINIKNTSGKERAEVNKTDKEECPRCRRSIDLFENSNLCERCNNVINNLI